jgi:hypothetical protein
MLSSSSAAQSVFARMCMHDRLCTWHLLNQWTLQRSSTAHTDTNCTHPSALCDGAISTLAEVNKQKKMQTELTLFEVLRRNSPAGVTPPLLSMRVAQIIGVSLLGRIYVCALLALINEHKLNFPQCVSAWLGTTRGVTDHTTVVSHTCACCAFTLCYCCCSLRRLRSSWLLVHYQQLHTGLLQGPRRFCRVLLPYW